MYELYIIDDNVRFTINNLNYIATIKANVPLMMGFLWCFKPRKTDQFENLVTGEIFTQGTRLVFFIINLFVHSFIHSFAIHHSSICLFIHPFIHLLILLFFYSFTYLFIQ